MKYNITGQCNKEIVKRSIQKKEVIIDKIMLLPQIKGFYHKTVYFSKHLVSIHNRSTTNGINLYIAIYSQHGGTIEPERLLGTISNKQDYEVITHNNSILVLITILSAHAQESRWYHINYSNRCVTHGNINHNGTIKAYFVKENHFNFITTNNLHEYHISQDGSVQINEISQGHSMKVKAVAYDPVHHQGMIIYVDKIEDMYYIGALDSEGKCSGPLYNLNNKHQLQISLDGSTLVQLDLTARIIKLLQINGELKEILSIEAQDYIDNILEYGYSVIAVNSPNIQIHIRNKTHIITNYYKEDKITQRSLLSPIYSVASPWILYGRSTCPVAMPPSSENNSNDSENGIMEVAVSAIASTLASTLNSDLFKPLRTISYNPPLVKINRESSDYYKLSTVPCNQSIFTIVYGAASLLGVPIPTDVPCVTHTSENPLSFVHLLYKHACFFGTSDEYKQILSEVRDISPEKNWIYPKVTNNCNDIPSCNSSQLINFYRAVVPQLAESFDELIHNVSCQTLWGSKLHSNERTYLVGLSIERASDWCRSMIQENLNMAVEILGGEHNLD